MLRQITLGLIVTGLVVGCGDDKPSDGTTTTTGTPGGTNATAGTAGDGGTTAGEGGASAGSNGTTANTDGGANNGGSDGGANNGGSDGGSDGGTNGGSDGGSDGGANNGGSDGGSDGGTDGGDDGGTDGGNGDPEPGPCNEANVEVGGCEDEAVSSCICGDLPECCIDPDEEGGVNGWDDVCVEAARIEGCFDCFDTHYGGGCNDDAIETCVCDSLEECCEYDFSEPSNPETGTGWTSLCRTAAIECRDEMM